MHVHLVESNILSNQYLKIFNSFRCGFEKPCVRCISLGLDCVTLPPRKRGTKPLNSEENSNKKYLSEKLWDIKISRNESKSFKRSDQEDFLNDFRFYKFPFEEPTRLPIEWCQNLHSKIENENSKTTDETLKMEK